MTLPYELPARNRRESAEVHLASERQVSRKALEAKPDRDAALRRLKAEDETDKREQAERRAKYEQRRGLIRE